MNYKSFVLVFAALFAFSVNASEFAPGRILVTTKTQYNQNEFSKSLLKHSSRIERKIGGSNSSIHLVSVPEGLEEETVSKLKNDPNVLSVELDEKIYPAATYVPNDYYKSLQWYLGATKTDLAWDNSELGNGVIIAILDTGVDGAHPDLSSKLVPGWNFFDNNSNTSDVHGHGTAVAGIAAASSNNSIGISSIAPQSKIMPIRIASPEAWAYWSTAATALVWAADNGAKVANISYVGVAASSTIQNAATYLKSKGGLLVVCAGNNGYDEMYTPTNTMVVVSATNSLNEKTSWSSFGNFVTIAAPGENMFTTTRGGNYGYWWGTSFSSPLVAGVVALIKSANPLLTPSQVENALYVGATDIGVAGRDPYYGYGLVNALNSVNIAKQTLPPPPVVDTTPPVITITYPSANMSIKRNTSTINIRGTITDASDLSISKLSINGVVVLSSNSKTINYTWTVRTVPFGKHTISIYAKDIAGNDSTKTVTVTRVNR
jgi:subtilisin family serine protease